ncbi:MAG TPA: OmpA family protein [Solirubrobacteraceae bacterium]|nr:OmpA family protein [Solirubrobacteraceae bacterium]
MAGHGGRGRRGRGAHAEHENDERWLLTYADMITLLMALFMVLFSISSVNISKYQTLQQSLKAAFSGSILPGGRSIMQSGSQSTTAHTPATAEIPSLVPLNPVAASKANPSIASSKAASAASLNSKQLEAALNSMSAALREQASLAALKQKLDAYAKAHGLSHEVQTVIDRRGLVVRVLTDQLLFASGQATLQAAGYPLLNEVAQLLNVDRSHPITVEGHTDNVPISSSQYPSNWELSTDRATTVVRYLIAKGVNRQRLGAVGYADLHPIASNATAAGRGRNRRVEIVLQRINPVPPS